MKKSERIKPIISGQIIFKTITKEGNLKDFESILEILKQKLKFLRRKTGAYIFSGGIISNLDLIKNKNGSLTASIRFNKAKPKFLDNLISTALSTYNKNSLSCSIKGNFDFNQIKSYLKDSFDWFEESKKSYSAKKRFEAKSVQIFVYPSMGVLSVIYEFHSKGKFDSNSPSKIIKNLCRVGGGTL